MSDAIGVGERTDEQLQSAVVVGLLPRQSPRVLSEAVRYTKLFGVQLVVAWVETPKYTGLEDPSAMLGGSVIDATLSAQEADFQEVEQECVEALVGQGVTWTLRRLRGEPATAIGGLADRLNASLIVVGTRRPGLGETLREFFNGSVAARLAHKQARSLLVVPHQEPTPTALIDVVDPASAEEHD